MITSLAFEVAWHAGDVVCPHLDRLSRHAAALITTIGSFKNINVS